MASSSAASSSSASRPTNVVSCIGRLFGRASSVRSGGKVVCESVRLDLVDPHRRPEVLEPVLAEIAQSHAVDRVVPVQLAGLSRHEDLAARGDRRDACRPVDPDADVAVADLVSVAGIDPDADPDPGVVGPWFGRQRSLGGHGRGDALPRLAEDDEERVALGAELPAVGRGPGVADHGPVPFQESGVPVAPDGALERRGALDVREEERQRPARQRLRLGHGPRPDAVRAVSVGALRSRRATDAPRRGGSPG